MRKYYSPLIGAALAAASLFQFSLPAFAAGTSAGTGLVNKATATYEDQDGGSYNVTSNEVTVTVGKIAGITNVPSNFTDNTSSATNTSILPRDSVSFDFEVTNTGNDAADIFIPEAANIDTQNLDNVQVGLVTTNAEGAETVINRGEAGFVDGIIPDVEENAAITIRVTGTVSSGASENDEISVQLGNTGTEIADDPNAPITQNQPDAGGAGDDQNFDVRTETADSATVPGDPVNGQREASAIRTETVGSQPLALPRLEKTNAGVTNGDDNDSLTDNTILYSLNLEVAGSVDPQVEAYSDFPFTPAALEGRAYNASQFDFTGAASSPASTDNLILISDAIPENTTLDSTNITAPNGWTVVYTTSPLTTAADDANWVATPPDPASNVTRIGWVYDAETGGALEAGSDTPGFGFQVITTGLTNNTATAIYNIGQVFGATDDGEAGVTGLPTYDESGDQNPANLNDDGTFGTVDENTTTDVDGEAFFGYADPDTVDGDNDEEDNVDPGDNSATGSEAGEVNKAIVTPEEIDPDLFNGPNGNADATGDALGAETPDNDHDFQNLAAATPGAEDATETDENNDGYFVTTYDPEAVTFTNTVQNTAVGTIRDVILEPISPEDLGLGGSNADLPADTRVVIIYDQGLETEQTAGYTYNADGTYTIDPDVGNGTPVVIPQIARNSEVNYQVRINLPADTQLSTDFEGGNPVNALVGGYPAVIAAYVDNGTTDDQLDADDAYNVTVNQVYTGYLQLVKKAQVLRDDGTGTLAVVTGMGYEDPDSAKQPAPADVLEYQITYTNISEDGGDGGTGNGLLQADDIVITEDGTANGNNWAVDNDDPAEDGDNLIDTLHVNGASNQIDGTEDGEIQYFDSSDGTGNADPGSFSGDMANFEVTDDVVKYQVSGINRLAPGEDGVFTFRRKITSPEDIDNLAPEPETTP